MTPTAAWPCKPKLTTANPQVMRSPISQYPSPARRRRLKLRQRRSTIRVCAQYNYLGSNYAEISWSSRKPSRRRRWVGNLQGSGLSDGDWVTLGAREVDDLAVAVAHLRTLEYVSTIGLWGRSMGAVTALLYAQKDPSIAGVVRRPAAGTRCPASENYHTQLAGSVYDLAGSPRTVCCYLHKVHTRKVCMPCSRL